MTMDPNSIALGCRAGALMNEAIQLLDEAGLTLPAAYLSSAITSLDAALLAAEPQEAPDEPDLARQTSISAAAN